VEKTSKTMVLAFTGKAGSGKDTAAGWVANNYGFEPVSFAAPLKAALAAMGLPEPRDREQKEKPVPGFDFTWRYAAQTLGTEWGRNILGQNLWTDLGMKKILAFDRAVVTDARFDNEAQALRGVGGVIIHLKGRQANLSSDLASHASEALVSFKDGDFVIENTGSIEELFVKIDNVLETIGFLK